MHCKIYFYDENVLNRFIGECLTNPELVSYGESGTILYFETERSISEIASELENEGLEVGVDVQSIEFIS